MHEPDIETEAAVELNARSAQLAGSDAATHLNALLDLGLSWSEIAKVCATTVATAKAWRQHGLIPNAATGPLAELRALTDLLAARFEVGDPAAWLGTPILAGAPVTPFDLWVAGRTSLVLRYARSGNGGAHYVLGEFDARWVERYARSAFEVFTASDGQRSIRPSDPSAPTGPVVRVLVGSSNEAKLDATADAFAALGFNAVVSGAAVHSGVAEQPTSTAETIEGARNRCAAAAALGGAEFFVGMEGGVFEAGGALFESGWMCVADLAGTESLAATVAYPLPDRTVTHIEAGRDIDEAMDAICDTGATSGFCAILSNGLVDRRHAYRDALIVALSRWVRSDLWVGELR